MLENRSVIFYKKEKETDFETAGETIEKYSISCRKQVTLQRTGNLLLPPNIRCNKRRFGDRKKKGVTQHSGGESERGKNFLTNES